MISFRGWAARGLSVVTAGLILAVAATPADARRKFGSASRAASTPATAAKTSTLGSAANGALIGLSVSRATRARLSKVFDLPQTEANLLSDGRYLHIGRLSGLFVGGSYVGWIAPTEYVSLSSAQLRGLLSTAGFNDVAEFEKHLATQPPQAETPAPSPSDDAAPAETAGGFAPMQMVAVVGGGLGLLGFLGYCFASWRRNTQKTESRAGPMVSARVTRGGSVTGVTTASVTTTRPAAARAGALPLAAAPVSARPTEAAPRRAPRDLSALTRKPQPV